MAQRVPAVLESGFLTDYSGLSEGQTGRASFVYRAPGLDLSGYDRLLLDHVTLWRDAERGFSDIADADLDRLALRLFTDLWEALDAHFEMVTEPGPGVMRVAVALTDVGRSSAPMDIYSADLSAAERLPSANAPLPPALLDYLANASIELELTDSASRRVLAAALDRRLAERIEDGRFDEWADVEWGLDAWARRLAQRMVEAREASSLAPERAAG